MSPRCVASWNVVVGCNYRCAYCVQKPKAPWLPQPAQLERAVELLATLPGDWEVKISGGEPFLLPQLEWLAGGLARAGHRVSVLTNLSAPLGRLQGFADAAGDLLRTFSCSLHPSQVDEAAFLAKAVALRRHLGQFPRATFVVNHVVVPGQVGEAERLRRRVEAAGLKFYPQLMRVDGRPCPYPTADAEAIHSAFGDLVGPGEMNRGTVLTGRACHSGSRYFVVHPKGDAYTCYPGKRLGDGWLGNLFDGTLRLTDGPRPCPYASCPCTVPQNRGIVDLPAELRPGSEE